MIKEQKAQGDVLLTPVPSIPDGAVKVETRTLAYGEATGHHHTLTQGEVWSLNGKMWVVAPEGTELQHQEHGTIAVAPGIYAVDLQIEVDPFTGLTRRVQD